MNSPFLNSLFDSLLGYAGGFFSNLLIERGKPRFRHNNCSEYKLKDYLAIVNHPLFIYLSEHFAVNQTKTH